LCIIGQGAVGSFLGGEINQNCDMEFIVIFSFIKNHTAIQSLREIGLWKYPVTFVK
jgi:ketopantoate reductase